MLNMVKGKQHNLYQVESNINCVCIYANNNELKYKI